MEGWHRVNGKEVFVAAKHHNVLSAWCALRARSSEPAVLVTLDYHTDLRPAFLRHLCRQSGPLVTHAPDDVAAYAESESRKIDFGDRQSVLDAEARLAHDEHIDCAHRAGVISEAFVLLGPDDGDDPQNGWSTVFETPCDPFCTKPYHDDDCWRWSADNVLEPIILDPRIRAIEAALGGALHERAYILDIDLDVFTTQRSVEPSDPSLFHKLISGAAIITVALEPSCVEECRLDGETITSVSLFERVRRHIDEATR